MPVVFQFYQGNMISTRSNIHCHRTECIFVKEWICKRALYLILMSEKFQQVRIKIFLATDFTLNSRVIDFVFICSNL